MPSSPVPQRSATPTRLMSQRVREAAERLAQQQTVASGARRQLRGNGNGNTSNSNSISNSNVNNGSNPTGGIGNTESNRESRARHLIKRFNTGSQHITS